MTTAPGTSASKPAASKAARDPRDTPAMRQYARFKAQHPECVLFFRMGDFYEMFDDDAKLVHEVLGLTLTQRTTGIPMAGVPHHAMEGYLRRMIEQGYRVAVCDQIQDPKDAKGVVDRAVTRVLTPGTLVDEALLEESAANQIAALHLPGGDADAVLAVAEVSTGAFRLIDVPRSHLADELARVGPSELLYLECDDAATLALLRGAGCVLTPRPSWTFRDQDAGDILRDHFGVKTLTGFGLDDGDPAIPAAGALVRYLVETQAPDAEQSADRLGHLRPPLRDGPDRCLLIDRTSLASLEIERTMRTGQAAGSLLAMLQHCVTAMGKRLLRQWLCFPLRDLETIEGRQRRVAALVDDADLMDAVRGNLGGVQDVARIVGRMGTGRATPRDLVALGRSVERITHLADAIDGHPAFEAQQAVLREQAGTLAPLAETIVARCVEAPPAHARAGGIIRDGVDAELDEARMLQRDAEQWLTDYRARLVDETGIPSLKVGFNKVFGYYIEVTHVHVDRIPATFTRKQTLKNAERYITPELKTFEDKVTTAEARAVERERILFEELCRAAAARALALAAYADVVAELDVLAGFAETAMRFGYVRPTLVDAPVLDIRQGRHPVLDRTLGDGFVPNDCRVGIAETEAEPSGDPEALEGGATLALITGPNMAGKSTYIRQVAIITLLAHTGSFVPAESAVIGLTDRIFTRIGASDELHTGQSTFMVEMTETASILHHATERSLVILDEIGRGTSTLDGLALAWAIAESIADRGCRALFATHYHELTDLADRLEQVTNLQVAVREWGDEIVFLFRILPGRTDRSYGIHVAKIAGLPRETIDRARQVLDTLTVHTDVPSIPEAGPRPAGGQLGLFTEYVTHPVVESLRAVDLNACTPLEAFDTLRRLVEEAGRS
jgi:DNA mismatch repair protein MutS